MKLLGSDFYNERMIRRYVDKNIHELVIKLNRLSYLQTTDSCGGHYFIFNNCIRVINPYISFFCDERGRHVSERESIRARRFVEKCRKRISGFKDRIPRYLLHERMRVNGVSKDDINYEEELDEMRYLSAPEFKCNDYGYGCFNGSGLICHVFFSTRAGKKVARRLRGFHREMLRELEMAVDEESG